MSYRLAREHHKELIRKANEHRRGSDAHRAAQARRQLRRARSSRTPGNPAPSDTVDTRAIRIVRVVAFVVAVTSVLPYLSMKVLWLTGSQIGMRPGAGVGEMDDLRFVIGNLITVGLAVLAIAFAVALVLPRRRLVPGWLTILLGGGSAGTLAPIALGLPVGAAIQLAIRGTTNTGGEGNLRGAVFAVVYSGFGLLRVALAALMGLYVLRRWPQLLNRPPQPPAGRGLKVGCSAAMLIFAAAMFYWGFAGPGQTGPAGFTAIEQRTVLVVMALMITAGVGVSFLRVWPGRHPRLAWLIGWVGCATAALQGPTLLLLSQHAVVRLPLVIVTLLATPAALIYGLTILSRSRRMHDHPATGHRGHRPAIGSSWARSSARG